ncbi:MAG: nuclear transport factor 2 family protein [Myxococcota bacterium]
MKKLNLVDIWFAVLLMIMLLGCGTNAKPGLHPAASNSSSGTPTGTNNNSRVLEPVKKQLAAYNQRKLKQFVAQFSPEVEVYDLKTGELLMQGKKAFSIRYAKLFKSRPELHCKLVKRIICGNFVIDEELVSGMVAGKKVHATAIYQVKDGLIIKVWFIKAKSSE